MKIKFLKDHLDNKAGDVIDVEDGLGNYLVQMKVAEKYIGHKPAIVQEPKPEKVEHKIVKEKVEFKESPGKKEKVVGKRSKAKSKTK